MGPRFGHGAKNGWIAFAVPPPPGAIATVVTAMMLMLITVIGGASETLARGGMGAGGWCIDPAAH